MSGGGGLNTGITGSGGLYASNGNTNWALLQSRQQAVAFMCQDFYNRARTKLESRWGQQNVTQLKGNVYDFVVEERNHPHSLAMTPTLTLPPSRYAFYKVVSATADIDRAVQRAIYQCLKHHNTLADFMVSPTHTTPPIVVAGLIIPAVGLKLSKFTALNTEVQDISKASVLSRVGFGLVTDTQL